MRENSLRTKSPIRLLIVEDSKLAAEAILRALRDGGFELSNPRVVDSLADFHQSLAESVWDVVITDYLLSGFNGLQVLEAWKRYQLEIPFLCVSGEIGDEQAAEIIVRGAHNFISKSNLERLPAVVERELSAAQERARRREVAEQTARLAAIVEGTGDAIFSRDLEGAILTWNSAAEKMYGYTALEIVGKPISTMVPANRLGELVEIRKKLENGLRIECLETTRRRKDGSIIDVSITVSPIEDVNGRVIGASIIARDITARRRLEDERLRLVADLQTALAKVKQLSGLLPICAGCKRIRDKQGYWHRIEVYVRDHSQADFTHGICPKCIDDLYPEISSRRKRS